MLPDRISDALPKGYGFLRAYVEYAATCSDAPEIYHVGVALTVMASACARKLLCPWIAGRTLVPNLYTLLVGPSGASRKTASMDCGIDLLNLTAPSLVIPLPGSYEELIAQIRATPSGMLTYREFGHFLKTTQKGYGEPIRTVLMDLHDWPPDRAYVRNLRKGKTIIEPTICLSMLSSISPDLLFAFTDSVEWTGGFFGRMLLLWGERDNFRMPISWPDARNYLAGLVYQIAQAAIPACGGFTSAAWTEFERWSRWRDSTLHEIPSRVQTHVARATTLAAKVALLYAADQGEPNAGQGWLVSHESMCKAILFVDSLYIESVKYIGERLTLGYFERDKRRILDAVEGAKQIGIVRRDLLKRVGLESSYMESVLTTLRETGEVIQSQESRGTVYRSPEATNVRVLPFGGGSGVSSAAGGGTP